MFPCTRERCGDHETRRPPDWLKPVPTVPNVVWLLRMTAVRRLSGRRLSCGWAVPRGLPNRGQRVAQTQHPAVAGPASSPLHSPLTDLPSGGTTRSPSPALDRPRTGAPAAAPAILGPNFRACRVSRTSASAFESPPFLSSNRATTPAIVGAEKLVPLMNRSCDGAASALLGPAHCWRRVSERCYDARGDLAVLVQLSGRGRDFQVAPNFKKRLIPRCSARTAAEGGGRPQRSAAAEVHAGLRRGRFEPPGLVRVVVPARQNPGQAPLPTRGTTGSFAPGNPIAGVSSLPADATTMTLALMAA